MNRMTIRELKEYYSSRVDLFTNLYDADRRTIMVLSLLRLGVFVGGIAAAIILFRVSNISGFIAIASSIILFGILLKLYSSRSWKRDYHSNMVSINSDELNTLDEDYSGFREGKKYIDPSHSFSHDIDMFGKGSLFQAVNRTCTGRGEALLASWLMNPYSLSDMFYERVEAVKELSLDIDWRQEFLSLGMMNRTSSRETSDFNDWLLEESKFSSNRFFRYVMYGLISVTLLLLILSIAGTVDYAYLILVIIVNLSLVGINIRKINGIHAKVSRKYNYLSIVSSLIHHFESKSFSSQYLTRLQSDLGDNNITALAKVNKLARIIHSFDSRLNMIMGVVLNALFLWDYISIIRIDKWKKEVSHLAPKWFETVALVDAIISLAGYASNNPGYCYPEISSGELFLEADNMGHHLIKSDKRVNNNYLIPERGSINIVTGANMAGKSTFLRTVSVNLVLAMNGVPVCADRFIFTPVDIFSSMRTTDSLSEEESYFFAELKRLRMLIDRIEKEANLFFVLDEILKGTNSKDKSEGAKAFIKKVIAMGGTGMIATHDISLGELVKSHPDRVINNCFEIEIIEGDVKFDFILRDGITSKMNAALLMKQQGII